MSSICFAIRELVRVRSLAEWLVRRGAGHVERLHISVALNMRDESESDGLDGQRTTEKDDQAEILLEMMQAVAVCAARGTLRDLQLRTESVPAWRLSAALVAAARGGGLERLGLTHIPQTGFPGAMAVVGPLHTLTSLRELHLQGELRLKPGLRLPLHLTSLHLNGDDGQGGFNWGVPRQVRAWHARVQQLAVAPRCVAPCLQPTAPSCACPAHPTNRACLPALLCLLCRFRSCASCDCSPLATWKPRQQTCECWCT